MGPQRHQNSKGSLMQYSKLEMIGQGPFQLGNAQFMPPFKQTPLNLAVGRPPITNQSCLYKTSANQVQPSVENETIDPPTQVASAATPQAKKVLQMNAQADPAN